MSLQDAFARIKEGQTEAEPIAAAPAVTAKPRKSAPAKKAMSVASAGGKSSNPDFVQLKVYVRADTRKRAARKWEDQGGRDVSDLVEHLLAKYLGS